MSIILSGDTHGLLDISKVTGYFSTHQNYTQNDYLIILGDTGLLWDGGTHDAEVQCVLESLPATVLWLDGNHENFDLLDDYPVDTWHGGKAQFITDKIIHLCRGQIFDIDGKFIFTFGGGRSIDKECRTEGRSWWPQEMPSLKEYVDGLDNLEHNGWHVDYIMTHTCPKSVARQLVPYLEPGEEPLQKYFDRIAEDTNFKAWYFGHWHMEKTIGKFHGLYDEIVEL